MLWGLLHQPKIFGVYNIVYRWDVRILADAEGKNSVRLHIWLWTKWLLLNVPSHKSVNEERSICGTLLMHEHSRLLSASILHSCCRFPFL